MPFAKAVCSSLRGGCQIVSSTHEVSPSKATCVTDVSIVHPNVFFRCGLVIDRDENA